MVSTLLLASGVGSLSPLALSTGQLLIILTLASILLFLYGFPIVTVFGFWTIGFHFVNPSFPMQNMAIGSFELLQSITFAAIALFILTGDLLFIATMSDDLIDFSQSLGGWLPGSSGNTALITSGFFSAITGSNAATTATVGKALTDRLQDEGYDPPFSAAVIAAGGTVGGMIPPSILMIIYGGTFSVSIPTLFAAGVIPGLAMLLGMLVVNIYYAKKRGYGITDFTFNWNRIGRTFWAAKAGLGTIALLFGGIYTGVFTPNESAAIAVLYILVVGFITSRVVSAKPLLEGALDSVLLVGVILPLVTFSTFIQQNLSYLGLGEVISNAIIGLGNYWLIVLTMMIIMLISGSVLASVPNLLLTAPLLAASAAYIGLTPIQWGIVFIISDMLGFITPPYGLNLYVISGITGIDYMRVARSAFPFLVILLVIWLVFFLFPGVNFLAPA